MKSKLVRNVEKPGARHPAAMYPILTSLKQMMLSLSDQKGKLEQIICNYSTDCERSELRSKAYSSVSN